MRTFTTSPTLDEFAVMARQALETIPAALRQRIDDVVLRVEDLPDEEVIDEMGLESPFELLGLYMGTPFGDKVMADTATQPDMIFLYRRPILDHWCEADYVLFDIVRNVLIHEIGHHFGLSDDDMDRLERME